MTKHAELIARLEAGDCSDELSLEVIRSAWPLAPQPKVPLGNVLLSVDEAHRLFRRAVGKKGMSLVVIFARMGNIAHIRKPSEPTDFTGRSQSAGTAVCIAILKALEAKA